MILQNSDTQKFVNWFVLCLSLLMVTGMIEAQALTVDQIIEKNIAASGGATHWAELAKLKITGTYTNFSDPESFTIWRQRPNKYRFDCERLNLFTIHAFDGEKAWWVNPLMGPSFEKPQKITSRGNLDLVTLRERFFEPVFWNYKIKGNKVELAGREKLDGESVYNLKVTLKDESIENWFINTETFLTVAMSGFTYDFGVKNRLDTFFSDYRDVSGFILPFLIESEYGIRYRTYEVDKIQINADFPQDVFNMPDSAAWAARKTGK